jgi:hypothetical protein
LRARRLIGAPPGTISQRAMDPSRPPAAAPAAAPRHSLATPFVWVGGSLLLTATTFVVSVIALFRAFGALF